MLVTHTSKWSPTIIAWGGEPIRTRAGRILHPPPRNDPVRILLVDDCPEYARAFLRSFPEGGGGLRVEATADPEDVFRNEVHARSLILLDIDLGPGLPDGISILKRLRMHGRRDRVYMLSCDETPESLAGSLLAGADGYMVKGIFGRRLRRNIERICTDSTPEVGAFHAYLRSRRLCFEQRMLLEAFSEAGYPLPKELGFDIGRSENAINKSLARIRNRLDLENNAQLVHLLTVLSRYGTGHGRSVERF